MLLDIDQVCILCGTRTRESPCAEAVRVGCNVREFAGEHYTVWRCARCQSLHCLEEIRYETYYANYPIRRQKYDFFARRIFQKRLEFLVDAGLAPGASLLDYGCGSGYFVEFARSLGYQAAGFEPYSSERYSDPSVLARQYDFVVSQDVLEHDPDPYAFLVRLKDMVRPGGVLAIGTPNAEAISLRDPLAPLDSLHVPYHRHLFSQRSLEWAMVQDGWSLLASRRDSYFDTRFPFVNSAFLVRLFQSGGGFMDAGFDPIRPLHYLRNPSLIFWGLFGSWFPRSQDILVIVRKDPSLKRSVQKR